jgi:hypothetical protein
MELINGQKSLIGSMGGACVPDRDFPGFLDWFQTNRLDLAALVTDRYGLDDVKRGSRGPALRADRRASRHRLLTRAQALVHSPSFRFGLTVGVQQLAGHDDPVDLVGTPVDLGDRGPAGSFRR